MVVVPVACWRFNVWKGERPKEALLDWEVRAMPEFFVNEQSYDDEDDGDNNAVYVVLESRGQLTGDAALGVVELQLRIAPEDGAGSSFCRGRANH